VKRLFCISLLVFAACGKKPEAAPAVAEQSAHSDAAVAAPVPTAAAPAEMPPASAKPRANMEDQLQGAVHPEMTMRLQMFLQIKGRLPESFSELQNMTGFDSTPGLPPAFKYEIDPKDKTVKIVRK
jgi:hypothetical protein